MAKITTITNPLTGQPAQVDQLDHTAQQIDDGLNIARGVSNPNLLDNWYFGNPVDQRQGRVVVPNTTYYSDNQLTTSAGTTSAYVKAYRYATGTANGVSYASFKLTDSDTAPTYYAAPENVVRGYATMGYTVDRWKNSSGNTSVLVTDSGLTMVGGTAYLTQKVEDSLLSELDGKIITISSLWTDNVLQTFTWVLNKSQSKLGNDGLYVYLPNDGFVVSRPIGESQKTVKAAKLELGDQQTLAHQDENGVWQLNEIPNYGEQLARCQRYYFKVKNGAYNISESFFTVQFPTIMRTAPSFNDLSTSAVGINHYDGNDSYYASGNFSLKYSSIYNATVKTAVGGSASLTGVMFGDVSFEFIADL